MTLHSVTNHPSARSYVLKLHRDANPELGQITGRLENLATGRCRDFGTGAELLACLVEDAALAAGAACTGTEAP
jgi:hypothetical protein